MLLSSENCSLASLKPVSLNVIFYSLFLLIAAFPSAAMEASLSPDEQDVLDYLKTLNLRYPKYGEDGFIRYSLSPNNIKGSAKRFLDELYKKRNGDIACLCGCPAKFFVYLLHGDSITSLETYRAYLGSPYLAHIGARDREANNFILNTNTVNCGLWLARTSRGWLGLSFDGLLILDSKQWIKRLVVDLKRDYENQIEKRFNDDEKAKITDYNLLEEESWCLRELYKTPDGLVVVESTCNDADWPDEKCKVMHELIKAGQPTEPSKHFQIMYQGLEQGGDS